MLDQRSAEFLPREITKKMPAKMGSFLALFVILCGYTHFKTTSNRPQKNRPQRGRPIWLRLQPPMQQKVSLVAGYAAGAVIWS